MPATAGLPVARSASADPWPTRAIGSGRQLWLTKMVGRGVPAEPSDEERLTRRVRPTACLCGARRQGWKRIKLHRFGA